LLKELSLFLEPVYDRFQINFAGADLLRDKNGKLWLLELNSRPVFSIFIRDNGKEPVVKMYEKMLNTFQ
jgi:D-alanine-D-alanine ligase-like ATP-grasp enzyme